MTFNPLNRIQQLLTPLRELIIDKPPYISGTIPLQDPCFSLLYRVIKDSNFARFDESRLLERP